MASNNTSAADNTTVASPSKGKGKAPVVDDPIDGEEEDDEDEDDEGDEDDEDEDEEVGECETLSCNTLMLLFQESYDDIDPSAILHSGNRTRGVVVDYNSAEALEKAGFKPGEADDDDDDDNAMN